MKNMENLVVGELVAQDYRTATVFKRHKIDFCCQGNRTVSEACEKHKVDPQILQSELAVAMRTGDASQTQAISELGPSELIDHIVEVHHKYVEQRSSEILPFLDKVVKVHGDKSPELIKIQELFYDSVRALAQHMKKEELILFPFIKRMVMASSGDHPNPLIDHSSVEQPILMMEHEHSTEGERFREIAELSNDYTPPEWACNTYRVTYALLSEFENDLHLHIHLENNILFPAAKALEEQLSQGA